MAEDKEIECPRCWKKMRKDKVRGPNVVIDVCMECGGVWLDHGELKKILGDKKLADYLTKDVGTKSDSKLLCPRCKGLMDLEYADNVEVDTCIECGGVWLDVGELKQLQDISEKGFEGDELAKEEERWEERARAEREGAIRSFLRKLKR